MSLTPKEAVILSAGLAVEKKAEDLVILEIGKVSFLADYFLLCTGTNTVMVRAICDHLMQEMKEKGIDLIRKEGYREGRWVILDYGFVVIHVFHPQEREFYNLERLWSSAPSLQLPAVL